MERRATTPERPWRRANSRGAGAVADTNDDGVVVAEVGVGVEVG